MRRACLVLVLVAATGLAWSSAASAYGWPVKPFFRQHPIRANFGDPRTVYRQSLFANGVAGPGEFSFHNGIDIAAPDGTAVYPVESGTAELIDGASVGVNTPNGRMFQFMHIDPAVSDGQPVIARKTILGYIQAPWGHVHMAEIDGTDVVNPLLPGHLAPYADHTRPQVDSIDFRGSLSGRQVDALAVCGTVSLVADAFDTQSIPVPGAWAGLPVAPALVTWSVKRLHGPTVVPTRVAADFRFRLPDSADFWKVYARGTYQNAPRFGLQQYEGMPGRFLFVLSDTFDTRALANGVYSVTVRATDERGNTGTRTRRFAVLNFGGKSGGCESFRR